MQNKNRLRERAGYLRSKVAKGIKASELPAVEPNGGDYGAGVIRNFAVITRGEARGHGFWIDDHFVGQVVAAMDGLRMGAKSHYTHPGLSGDGLSKFVGRAKSVRRDGDFARADLHIVPSAHNTPDGNLAQHLMQRASEDPESFGASIVFAHDFDAEDAFLEAHGGKDEFKSPDPFNTGHLPHARLGRLRAVDLVGDPAANPLGLFSRGQEVVSEAEECAKYALGLTNEEPHVTRLDFHPQRVREYVIDFLHRHNLAIVPHIEKEGDGMGNEKPVNDKPADEPEQSSGDKPADESVGESEGDKQEQQPAGEPDKQETQQAEGKRFLEAFGPQGGVWFAEGKSFAEAQGLWQEQVRTELAQIKEQNQQLKKLLGELRGEKSPVSQGGELTEEEKSIEGYRGKLRSNGAAALAASIKLPK